MNVVEKLDKLRKNQGALEEQLRVLKKENKNLKIQLNS